MQVFPALPWQRGINGGEIKLSTPIELSELSDRLSVVLSYHGQGQNFEEAIFTTEGADIILAKNDAVRPVRMYNVTLSEDGKTIYLTNPTADAESYPIWDVQERAMRLYPSFPLSAGSNALLILPQSMTSEELQEGLFPIFKDSHDEEVVGKVVEYPSDHKLYIATNEELWLRCANVDNQITSAMYYSLQLQPYSGQTEHYSLENILTTPSVPVMVPNAPWNPSIESGEVILPEPMTYDDIKDGALVFATDYEKGGTHYDHFTIINQGSSITLQIGDYRTFDIVSWVGAKSVIRLQRATGYEPAPLTAVKLLDSIFIRPGTPWNNSVNEGLVRLPYEANMENVEDDFKFLSTQVVDGEHQYFDIRVTKDEAGWVESVYLAYNGVDIYSLDYTTRGNNTLITFTKIAPSATVFLQAVEEIQAFPVQGDVQIFTSNRCTKLATGTVSVVYARINKPWTEPWEVGTEQGNSFNAMSDQYGADCALWSVFLSARSWPGYNAGDVIEFDSARGRVDVTNFTKVFTKPA